MTIEKQTTDRELDRHIRGYRYDLGSDVEEFVHFALRKDLETVQKHKLDAEESILTFKRDISDRDK